MIRPRYLPDSIVAQLVSVSAFSHSLDPERTFIGHASAVLVIKWTATQTLGSIAQWIERSDSGAALEKANHPPHA